MTLLVPREQHIGKVGNKTNFSDGVHVDINTASAQYAVFAPGKDIEIISCKVPSAVYLVLPSCRLKNVWTGL